MPEQDPSQSQTEKRLSRNHVGELGLLLPARADPIDVEITYDNFVFFTIFSQSLDRFVAPGQGTGLIVPSLQCYTGQYSPSHLPRKSRGLSAFLKDGEFLEFYALNVHKDATRTNGGSHQDVVEIETIENEPVQKTLDVNLLYAVTGKVATLLWEGSQA